VSALAGHLSNNLNKNSVEEETEIQVKNMEDSFKSAKIESNLRNPLTVTNTEVSQPSENSDGEPKNRESLFGTI